MNLKQTYLIRLCVMDSFDDVLEIEFYFILNMKNQMLKLRGAQFADRPVDHKCSASRSHAIQKDF